MATDTRKVAIGAVLLVASSALILATGTQGSGIPPVGVSIAALGLAAGSLYLGTSEDGQAV